MTKSANCQKNRPARGKIRFGLPVFIAAVAALLFAVCIQDLDGDPDGGVVDKFAMYTLATGASPENCGTVSRDPEQATYQNGTEVTLTAEPVTGYRFVKWSDASIPATNPATVKITQDMTLNAVFELIPPDQYALTIDMSHPAAGTVSRNPDRTSYPASTEVTVTVEKVTDGYTFIGWSGASTDTAKTIKVIMDNNLTLTAKFKLIADDHYTLTVKRDPADGGAVTRNPNFTEYAVGTEVTVTATPEPGYGFIGWEGDVISAKDTIKVTMSKDLTLTAKFKRITYTVTCNINYEGGILLAPHTVNAGDGVNLGEPERIDYKFIGWSVDSSGSEAAIYKASSHFTPTADITLYARWIPVYKLTAGSPAGGTVTVKVNGIPHSSPVVPVDSGGTAEITAGANASYVFSKWEVTSGTDTPANAKETTTTITLHNHATITASFKRIYIVTYDVNGGSGTAPAPQMVEEGESVDIADGSGLAMNNYRFDGWSTRKDVAGDRFPVGILFKPTSDITLYARWIRQYKLTIIPSEGPGGDISVGDIPYIQPMGIDSGLPVKITAAAANKNYFTGWTVMDGNPAVTNPGSASDAAVELTSDATIVAHFNISGGYQFNPEIVYGSFIDTRGGINTFYRKIKIGKYTWMAENLNYRIPGTPWTGTPRDTGMCYNNVSNNCAKTGRLYNWTTATVTTAPDKKPCPPGWILPDTGHFNDLARTVGGEYTSVTVPHQWVNGASQKLKSKSAKSWESVPGTDNYGFSALAGGHFLYSRPDSGDFGDFGDGDSGQAGNWWTATPIYQTPQALRWTMHGNGYNIYVNNGDKSDGYFSIRCVEQ